MANLKDIKNRIKGVKSTQKITKAMKMISTARLNKAKITLGVISQYHNAMKIFLHSTLGTIDTYAIESDIPLVQNIIGKSVAQKRMVVVFTTDKGLCGALNTLVLREFESSLAKNDIIYVVGKKGFDYSKSRHTIYNKHAILSAKCHFDEISEDIFTTIIKSFVLR